MVVFELNDTEAQVAGGEGNQGFGAKFQFTPHPGLWSSGFWSNTYAVVSMGSN